MGSEEPTFVQICPAVGWFAVYKRNDGYWKEPIAVWAITSNGDVHGLVGGEYLDSPVGAPTAR